MLEAGTVRSKNVSEIILKNIIDVNVTGICWWAFGFAIAFVPSGNAFAGGNGITGLFVHDISTLGGYSTWFFQWCFASAATSIVSGAVAERCKMTCYVGYAILMTICVYPVFCYWSWSSSGWLSPFNSNSSTRVGNGLIDFSGCGVVHLTGGFTSLIGAYFVGARKGRFLIEDDGVVRVVQFTMNSVSVRSIGVFTLWFGWYFFNSGTVFGVDRSLNGWPDIAARICVNTTISACACGLTSVFLSMAVRAAKGESRPVGIGGAKRDDLMCVTNGVLAGLVSITASCSVVESWMAALIGAIASFVWMFSLKLLLSLEIDDAVDAVPVHLACGVWGLIAAAIFAKESYVLEIYGFENSKGLVYGGDGMYLATALLFIVCSCIWNAMVMVPFFWFCDKMGLLKYSDKEIEDLLNTKSHGDHFDFHPNRAHGGPRGKIGASVLDRLDYVRAEESYSLNDSQNSSNTPIAGVEMLLAGNISQPARGLSSSAHGLPSASYHSSSNIRGGSQTLYRRNIARINIRMLEKLCSKPGVELDKATVVALAMQSNAPDDVLDVLSMFETIAGGSGIISGGALQDFCSMIRKSQETELMLSTRDIKKLSH